MALIDDVSNKAVKASWKLLDELRRSIADQISDAVGRGKTLEVQRLQQVLADVNRLSEDFAVEVSAKLGREIERAWQAGQAVSGVTIPALSSPSLATLGVAQSYVADLVTKMTNEMKAELTRQIRLATLGGTSPLQLMRDLSDYLGSKHALKAGTIAGETVEGIAYRAEVITRTELNRVFNESAWRRIEDRAQAIPGMTKTWITAGDGRVRVSHERLNDVTIPVDEDFEVEADDGTIYAARGPHDPRLPAGEVIMCRCRLVTQQGETSD